MAHFKLYFENGEVCGNPIDELKYWSMDNFVSNKKVPIFYENGKEIKLEPIKENKKIIPFKGNYLRDYFTGKVVFLSNKEKIGIERGYEYQIATSLKEVNKLSSDEKGTFVLREFIYFVFFECDHTEIQKLVEQGYIDYIIKGMEIDGWEHYYKIILKNDNLKILLENTTKEYVRKIYYSCVFAYNNLMTKKEKEQFVELIKNDDIQDLLYFNGELDTKDSKFCYRNPEYYIEELLKQPTTYYHFRMTYDITESKYFPYLLRNRSILRDLIVSYDPVQYLIILSKLKDLPIDSKIKEDFMNDYDFFLYVFGFYGKIHLCLNDDRYKYKLETPALAKKDELLLALKLYAPSFFFKCLIDIKAITSDTSVEKDIGIAVRISDLRKATITYNLIPKKISVDNISSENEQNYVNDYIFLKSCGSGVYEEKITGLKFFCLDEVKNLKIRDINVSKSYYHTMYENALLKNFEEMPCFENAIIITNYNKDDFKKFRYKYNFDDEYCEEIKRILKEKYNIWHEWKYGTKMQFADEVVEEIKELAPEPIEELEETVVEEIEDASEENILGNYYVRTKK